MIGFKEFSRKKVYFIAKLTTVLALIVFMYLMMLPMAKAEIYLSLPNTEKLVETERKVIDSVKYYLPLINDVTKKRKLERFLAEFEKEHEIAQRNVEYYIGNPVNAFRLVKRLTRDVEDTEDILKEIPNYVRPSHLVYPTTKDLEGAMKGLIHLKIIYNLNVQDLASGIIRSNISQSQETYVEFASPMTASECYELALAALEYNEYDTAIDWTIEALNRHKDCEDCSFTETQLVYFISRIYLYKGNIEDSLLWREKSLTLNLTNQQREENKRLTEHLRSVLGENHRKKLKKQTITTNRRINKNKVVTDNETGDMLCVAETSRTFNNKSLHCYYKYGPSPGLRVAPFKVEQLHLDPDVLMFHDVVSENDIEELKMTAKPLLSPTSQNPGSQPIIKEIAWLRDNSSKIAEKISIRMSHFTGYAVNRSQILEVGIYGIGGFHGPHYDFRDNLPKICSNTPEIEIDLKNWRLCTGKSTVMIYLSDVEQGGATVFLPMRLTIFPKKKAAITWTNLLPSGFMDSNMLHAGCPVLRGYKWTATKLM